MSVSPVLPSGTSSTLLPGSPSRSPYQVWPNPLPLEGGIIRTQERHTPAAAGLSKRFNVSQLRKLLLYLKDKGKRAYPNIRFVHWLQIATSRLDMSENLAWLYFETFDVVSDISASDRLQYMHTVSSCSTQTELRDLRKKLSVDTLKFFLFLYLQNSPRFSLKSAVMSGDEWPSPESDLRQKSSEQYHLAFLRAHLPELLELLQDSSHLLSEESVGALDFVFTAFKDCVKCSVLSLALSAPLQSGYNQDSKSFSPAQLEAWLRSILSANQCGPHSLFSRRRDLRPLSCFRSDGVGRVLNSSSLSPDLGCSLLYRINRQTLAVSNEVVHHNSVYIRNCQRSTIYLLAPVRMVQVERCSHCVMVLGAVSSVLVVNNSDNLTVIAACRSIHVSSSSTCVFHLLTATRPLLLHGCQHITLAPYNTHYPRHRTHLHMAGLTPDINSWDSPLDLSALGYGGKSDRTSSGEAPPTWGLMPPELFQPMEVPFDMEGPVEGIACAIPPVYLHALTTRKERIKSWYDCVSKAGLSKDQSKQLSLTVKEHFEDWLAREGHKKELIDLGQKPSQFTMPLEDMATDQNGIGSRSSSQLSDNTVDKTIQNESN